MEDTQTPALEIGVVKRHGAERNFPQIITTLTLEWLATYAHANGDENTITIVGVENRRVRAKMISVKSHELLGSE